jgi:PAS domain S-box-containing protein
MSKRINISAALFSFLLEETNDIILLVDGALRIRASSMAAKEQLKLPNGGRGFLFTDLLPKDKTAAFASAAAQRGPRNATVDLESAFLLPDGGVLRARLLLRKLQRGGGGDSWTLVLAKPYGCSDASRFGPLVSLVMRGYAEPAFVVDASRLIFRDCNEPATAVFGWRREELAGQPISVLTEGGVIAPAILRKARIDIKKSGVFQLKTNLKRRDGVLLCCQCTNVALFDEEGAIADFLSILHDRSAEEARKAEIRHITDTIVAAAKLLDSQTAPFATSSMAPRLSELGLSERQIAIARLIASGASSKSIAFDLEISEATVKSHISTIFRKTSVKSRIELISLIHRRNYTFT